MMFWWLNYLIGLVQSRYKHKTVSSKKLFVFGDSYADTGNWKQTVASSWKKPYGITYPGNPSGRFSDGRILTDYIGKLFSNTCTSIYKLSLILFLYTTSVIGYVQRFDIKQKGKMSNRCT